MPFSNLIYPSCHLCRTLRASMCAGLVLVLVTYVTQLIGINREMRAVERAQKAAHLPPRYHEEETARTPLPGANGREESKEHGYAKLS